MAAVKRAKTIAVSHLGRTGTGRHHSDTVIAARLIRGLDAEHSSLLGASHKHS